MDQHKRFCTSLGAPSRCSGNLFFREGGTINGAARISASRRGNNATPYTGLQAGGARPPGRGRAPGRRARVSAMARRFPPAHRTIQTGLDADGPSG